MNLFARSSSAEKHLATDIKKQVEVRDDLASRLESARTAVESRKEAAQRLASTGADGPSLDAADGDVIKAETRVMTLTGALVDSERKLAELERKYGEITDQRQRRETVDEIAAIITDVQAVGREFDAVLGKLVEVAKRAGLVVPDGLGLQLFAEQLQEASPPAFEIILSSMKAHAGLVKDGTAPAALRKPPPPPAPVAPPEPMTRVYTTKTLHWQDRGNPALTQRRPSYTQTDLPPDLAKRAIELNAAIGITDARVATLARSQTPKYDQSSICLDETSLEVSEEHFDENRLLKPVRA